LTKNQPSARILSRFKIYRGKEEKGLTDTDKIKQLISESGFKMQYVASKLGITRAALSLKLNNKSEFKTSEVAVLCELLGINSLEKKEEIFFMKKVD
jgi:transcriptional regulator with XRE-family HTH domain